MLTNMTSAIRSVVAVALVSVLALVAPRSTQAATAPDTGYRVLAADGGVFAYGSSTYLGGANAIRGALIVAGAPTATRKGYWLAGSNGAVFALGDAVAYGSAASLTLAAPIAGIGSQPTGDGYALVAQDGGVFTFGSARYVGNAVPYLTAPAVGIASWDTIRPR